MKGIKIYIIFLVLMIVFSCDKIFVTDVNCQDCLLTEPKDTDLLVKLGAPFYVSGDIIVNEYEGLAEDSILVETYSRTGADFSVNISLNKNYTFTATYKDLNGNRYTVVNSIISRAKFVTGQCNSDCYMIIGTEIDLALKYR